MKNALRSYIFWTYERGSMQYDVMVTIILLFVFVSPHFIDFKARPVADVPTQNSEVFVRSAAPTRFVYEIRVEALHGARTDSEIRDAILRVIEPIAGGPVTLENYRSVVDGNRRIVAYDATVIR
jgi:hypothetical protein